jgi:DNA-binding protein H-NS
VTQLNYNSQWYNDYLSQSKAQDRAKLFSKPTLKTRQKFIDQTERFISGYDAGAFSAMVDLTPDVTFKQVIEDKYENMAEPFRFSVTEQNERIATYRQKAKDLQARLESDESEAFDLTGNDLANRLRESAKNKIDPALVVNPYRYHSEQVGNSQTRIYDLADGYSMSQFQNRVMARGMGSWFGTTRRVKSSRFGLLQLQSKELNLLSKLFEENELAGRAENLLTSQEKLRKLMDEIDESPDNYWMWDNLKDASALFMAPMTMGFTLLDDDYLSPWNRDTLADHLLNTPDKGWEEDKAILLQSLTGGTGEILSEHLGEDYAALLREHPELIEGLKRSKNVYQFIGSINRTRENKVLGDYTMRSGGQWGTEGFMNMLGYGFTSDPTLPIDIAVTAGLTVFSGGTWLLGRGAMLLGKTTRRAGAAHRAIAMANAAGKNPGKFLRMRAFLEPKAQVARDAIMFSRRLMPTQIVSELIFPSLKFLRGGAAARAGAKRGAAARNYFNYLKKEEYLGKTAKARIAHRAVGGFLEGTVWGGIEYAHMTDYEDRTNRILLGQEASATIAWQRKKEGALLHMLAASAGLGTVLGPTIGEAFTGMGKLGRWIPEASLELELKIATKLDYIDSPTRKKFGQAISWAPKKLAYFLAAPDYVSAKKQIALMKAFGMVDQEVVANLKELAPNDVEAEKKLSALLADIERRVGSSFDAAEERNLDFTTAFEAAFRDIDEDTVLDPKTIQQRIDAALENQFEAIRDKITFRNKVRANLHRNIAQKLFDDERAQTVMDENVDIDTDEAPVVSGVSEAGTKNQVEIDEAKQAVVEAEEALEAVRDRESPEAQEREADLEQQYSDREKLASQIQERVDAKDGKSKQEKRELQRQINEIRKEMNKLPKRPEVEEDATPPMSVEEAENKVMTARDNLEEKLAEFDDILLDRLNTNPDEVYKLVAWYRKKTIDERLYGGEANDVYATPIITYLQKKIEEAEGAVTIANARNLLQGAGFTLTELRRAAGNQDLDDDVVDFINSILDKKAAVEIDAELLIEYTKKIAKAVVVESAGKDESLFETGFAVGVFEQAFAKALLDDPAADPKELYNEIRMAELTAELGATVTPATRDNPNVTWLFGESPQNVATRFAEARQNLADRLSQITTGDVSSTVDGLSTAVLNTLGGRDGFKIKGWSRMSMAKKKAALKKEFAKYREENKNFPDEVKTLLESLQPEGEPSAKMARAVMRDVITETADANRRKIINDRINTKKQENSKYQKKKARLDNILGEGEEKLTNRKEFNRDKLKAELKEMDESFTKATEAEWDEGGLREAWIDRQMMGQDIQLRENAGHTDALIKVISMLRTHLHAHSRISSVLGMNRIEVDTSISRLDLLSIFETAEKGYAFLINIDGIKDKQNAGIFNGKDVLDELISRLSNSDETLGEYFREGFQSSLNSKFGKAIPGTENFETVYTTDGEVRNVLNMLDSHIEGKERWATETFNTRGGYANDADASGVLTEADWNSSFNESLMRLFRNLNLYDMRGSDVARGILKGLGKEIDDISPDQLNAALLEYINKDLGDRRLTNFSDLGSSRDYVGPQRAANAVLAAVTGEGYTTRRMADTQVIKNRDGNIVASRVLGEEDRRGLYIQSDSDSNVQKNYEMARHNHFLGRMLDEYQAAKDEGRSDELIEGLKKTIEKMRNIQGPLRVRASAVQKESFRLLPRWGVFGPDQTMAQSIDEMIEYNQTMMQTVTPSMFVTVHDSVHAMLPSLMTQDFGAAGQANWNYSMVVDGKTIYPWRGVGFGFSTMAASRGSFQDAINVMFSITHGYDDLVELGRLNYNKLVGEMGEDRGLPKFESESEFVGWMAKNYDDQTPEVRTKIAKAFFPKVPQMDADSSGSNIMLALVMGSEAGQGKISGLMKRLVAEAQIDDAALKEAHNTVRTTAYKEVEEFLLKQLDIAGNLRGLDPENLSNLQTIVKKIADDGNAKELFKSAVMTDPYGAGYKLMTKKLKEVLTEKHSDLLTEVLGEDLWKLNGITETWGRLLADASVRGNMGWIKKAIFGLEGFDNNRLGEILQDYAKTSRGNSASRTLVDTELAQGVNTGEISNRRMTAWLGDEDNLSDKSGTLNEDQLIMQFLTVTLNKIDALTAGTGVTKERRVALQKRFIDDIQNGLIKSLRTPEMIESIKTGDKKTTQRLFDEKFNEFMEHNIMIRSLNEFTRTGYGYDKNAVNQVLDILFPGNEGVVRDILERLSPMARYSLDNDVFRALGISTEGRIFVKSATDQVGEKGLRVRSPEALFGVGRMSEADFDPKQIEDLTVLQAIRELSEIYDVRSYMSPNLKNKFDELTLEKWYANWESDSKLGDQIREASLKLMGEYQSFKEELSMRLRNDNSDDSVVEVTEQDKIQAEAQEELLKILSKMIDARNEARPTDKAKYIAENVGETVTGTGRLPHIMGHLPKTVIRPFRDAPIPLLRKAQVERTASAQELRFLERGVDQRTKDAVFTDEELSSPIPENLLDLPKFSGNKYDTPLAKRTFSDLRGLPSPDAVAKTLKNELDAWVNQSGNKTAEEYRNNDQWYELYQLYRNFNAAKEEAKVEATMSNLETLIAGEKSRLRSDFEKEFNKAPDPIDLEMYYSRSPKLVELINELQKLEDQSALRYSEILNIDGSWADDAGNRVWSIMGMDGQNIKDISSGRTYGEAMQKTAYSNVTVGNMAAWLLGEADVPGTIVAEDAAHPIKIKQGSKIGTGARVAQSEDSTLLYMTNWILSTAWSDTVKKMLRLEDNVDPTSSEISVFLKWWDYTKRGLRNSDNPEIRDFMARHETTIAKLDEFTATEILDFMDAGLMKAKEIFSKSNSAVQYMSKPSLKEVVADNLREQFGGENNLDRVLAERYNTDLDTVLTERRFLKFEEGQKFFVGPMGNLIYPHQVTGRGIIQLTMQDKVMSLNNIQNQPVVDRMRLASLLDRNVPTNAELSSNLGGYDPFVKFPGLSIKSARENAAILAEGLDHLMKTSRGKQRLETVTDQRYTMLVKGKPQAARFPLLNQPSEIEQYKKQAAFLYSETILESFGFSKDIETEIKQLSLNVKEEIWSTAIKAATLANEGHAPKETYFAMRQKDSKFYSKSGKELDIKELEAEWVQAREITKRLNSAINGLEETHWLHKNPAAIFRDVAPDEITDPTLHQTAAQMYIEGWTIQQEVVRRVNNADFSSRSQADMAVNEINMRDAVAPSAERTDGTQVKPNTAAYRASLFSDQSEVKRDFSNELDALVAVGTLTQDDAVVLKLAFWDTPDRKLLKIFGSRPYTGRGGEGMVNIQTDFHLERVNGLYSHRDGKIRLYSKLTDRFDDAPLGPANVVLEEVGHAIGTRLTDEGKANFLKNVAEVEMDRLTEAGRIIANVPKDTTDAYAARIARLATELEGAKKGNLDIADSELFGTMFAVSALRRIPAYEQFKGLDFETIQNTYAESLEFLKVAQRISDLEGLGDPDLLFKDPVDNLTAWVTPKRSSITDPDEDELNDIYDGLAFPRVDRNATEEVLESGDIKSDEVKKNAYKNQNQNEVSYEAQLRREMDNATDPETGLIDQDVFLNNTNQNRSMLNAAILRKGEEKLERAAGGMRVSTPGSEFISSMFLGMLTPNKIARATEILASPFGGRQFAYDSDGKVQMTAVMLGLLEAMDAQSYMTTGSFTTATPTVGSLGVSLAGDFDTLLSNLVIFKGQNITEGPKGRTNGTESFQPYNFFELVFRDLSANYKNKEEARDLLEAKVRTIQGGEDLVNSPNWPKFSNMAINIIDLWAHPQKGVWRSVVNRMISSGMVTKELGERLVSEGAYPLKFIDSVFNNETTGPDSPPARQELRDGFVRLLKQNMNPDNNNGYMDIDLFQIAFANYLPTLAERKSQAFYTKKAINLPPLFKNLLAKYDFNADKLYGAVKRGEVRFDELDTTLKDMYRETLKKDGLYDNAENVRQNKMLEEILRERNRNLSPSQKRSGGNLSKFNAAEYLAWRYMTQIGSSSYSFVGDNFLTPKNLLSDPNIGKFFESDPVAILNSVKRGTAAQAYDKAMYGNYFGVKGLGIKDVLNMYRGIVDEEFTANEQVKMLFVGKGFDTSDGIKRPMNNTERRKMSGALKHMERLYDFAVGTRSTDDIPEDNPFLNILNIVSELGTAISIAPRLAIATAIEETPHSVMSVLKDNLTNMQGELGDALAIVKSKEDLASTLEGLGHLTASAMHHAAALAAKAGMDLSPSDSVKPSTRIKSLYRFLSIGLDRQTMAARSIGAMQFNTRIDKMFNNMVSRKASGHITMDEFRNSLMDLTNGDLSRITPDQIRTLAKSMGIKDSKLYTDITEMIKVGLFSEELYPYFKDVWLSYRDRIIKTGVPFDDIRKDITFELSHRVKNADGQEIDASTIRENKLHVVNALRELVYNASVLYAKQPIASYQPVGASSGGALATFLTRLTTYQSATFNNLRRAMLGGTAMFTSAYVAHAITGWLYYKLVQLQTHKTLEDMKKEMKKDPLFELREALMSVPFFGANQMAINIMLQMLRGERAVNSQPIGFAAQAQVNGMLQILPRAMRGTKKMMDGDITGGGADLLNRIPIPWAWIFQLGLRQAGSLSESDAPINLMKTNPSMPTTNRRSSSSIPTVTPNQKNMGTTTLEQPGKPVQDVYNEAAGIIEKGQAHKDILRKTTDELVKIQNRINR